MTKNKFSKKILVICGATASGKTGLFEKISAQYPGCYVCINADTGQMYRELSIGTAKPDLTNEPNPQDFHLFDILNLGEMFSAGKFRKRVLELVEMAWSNEQVPVIVGGSMFYINALFFPPEDPVVLKNLSAEFLSSCQSLTTSELYAQLQEIDPARAQAIMPNDRFRIVRALEIWEQCKIKPSELEPRFTPLAETELCFVHKPQAELDARIALRLKQMLYSTPSQTWLDEAKQIYARPEIREFICSSRLIGYKEIFAWLDRGGKSEEIAELEQCLYLATRNYAKKQLKFWRRLEQKILMHDNAHEPIVKFCSSGVSGIF